MSGGEATPSSKPRHSHLLVFYWPQSSHVATPARKGGWETGSAGRPGRGGDGARWVVRVPPHALFSNPSADPCCSEIGAFTPGRAKSSLRNQRMLRNLSPSSYPRSIPPAGLGSVLKCHEQSPRSGGTEKLFSENGPIYKVAFSRKNRGAFRRPAVDRKHLRG